MEKERGACKPPGPKKRQIIILSNYSIFFWHKLRLAKNHKYHTVSPFCLGKLFASFPFYERNKIFSFWKLKTCRFCKCKNVKICLLLRLQSNLILAMQMVKIFKIIDWFVGSLVSGQWFLVFCIRCWILVLAVCMRSATERWPSRKIARKWPFFLGGKKLT